MRQFFLPWLAASLLLAVPSAVYAQKSGNVLNDPVCQPRRDQRIVRGSSSRAPTTTTRPGALPQLDDASRIPEVPAARPEAIDQVLDINLATALQLSGARPLVIQAAVASQMTAFAQLERAQVLWLPDINLGTDYQRHDGAQIRTTGEVAINSRNQFMAGGGAERYSDLQTRSTRR